MHMSTLKRVLQYLKGTINYQLKFGKKRNMSEKLNMNLMCRGTELGILNHSLLVYRDGNLIYWKSRKQLVVALSST